MSLEWSLFVGLLFLGMIALWRKARGLAWPFFVGIVGLGSAAVFGATKWYDHQQRRGFQREQYFNSVPQQGRPGGFVSSDTCQSCHPDQYASWHQSYHR